MQSNHCHRVTTQLQLINIIIIIIIVISCLDAIVKEGLYDDGTYRMLRNVGA